jgi:hypothetical protein
MVTKKNNGNVPELTDPRIAYIPVPCGRCIECMRKKKREWQVRLMEEIKVNKEAIFVTLTFSEESLKELEKLTVSKNKYIQSNEIATIAVRRFLERHRKKYGKSIKHWLVTELGHVNTERIHLHGIIFKKIEKEELDQLWKYGITWIGSYVNERTINYIVKYINKQDPDHKNYIPKILCSAGIGASYLKTYNAKKNKYDEENTREYYITRQGYKLNLPSYYRRKIYNDEEREKLWIKRLDEGMRWIMGEKLDAYNEEEIQKTLEYYRRINKELGYNDDEKNFDEIDYKNKITMLKLLKNEKGKK